jgi:hypothetical protein
MIYSTLKGQGIETVAQQRSAPFLSLKWEMITIEKQKYYNKKC